MMTTLLKERELSVSEELLVGEKLALATIVVEGRKAFDDRRSIEECPYSSREKRWYWRWGWLGARDRPADDPGVRIHLGGDLVLSLKDAVALQKQNVSGDQPVSEPKPSAQPQEP